MTRLRDVVLGLGANLGSRVATLRAALHLVTADDAVDLVALSPFYETAPVGPPQPTYVNAAARVRTRLSLEELHERTLSVERALGRRRTDGERWGPRVLDIDLLWAFDETIDTDALTVPHPRLEERAFAVFPLLDVAREAFEPLAAAARALGDRPPEIAIPHVTVDQDGSTRRARAMATDPDDALAFALAALARPRDTSAVTAIEVDVLDEDPGSFLSAFAGAIGGSGVRAVSLAIRPPAGPALRVVRSCEDVPGTMVPTDARLGGSNGRFVASLSLRIGNSRDVAK